MSENKSVKNLRKQLMAAVAMVMVAAVALTSATYAWFANNNKVTASGMNVTAVTEGANLEVSFTKGSFTAGTIETSTTDAATLKPTHVVTAADIAENGKYYNNSNIKAAGAGSWAHAFSAAYNAVSTDNTYINATSVDAVGEPDEDATDTDYALVVPVYLRLNPQSKNVINDIKATATITWSAGAGDGGTGMQSAGRVAFFTDPDDIAISGNTGYTTNEQTGSLVSINTAGDTGAKVVYAVIYFDGDDESCTSEKFDTDKYTVSLSFAGTIGGAITA